MKMPMPNMKRKGEEEEEEVTFPCTVCSATFVTQMSLIRHMILHEEVEEEEYEEQENGEEQAYGQEQDEANGQEQEYGQELENGQEEDDEGQDEGAMEEDKDQEDNGSGHMTEQEDTMTTHEGISFSINNRPSIEGQNLLETILKNGSKAVQLQNNNRPPTRKPVPGLKPIPSLIQLKPTQCPQADRTFQCQLCGVFFRKKEDLSRHVTRTHGNAKFTCPYCQRNISRRDHLKRHIKNVHPEFCTATEVGPFLNQGAGRPPKHSRDELKESSMEEPNQGTKKIKLTSSLPLIPGQYEEEEEGLLFPAYMDDHSSSMESPMEEEYPQHFLQGSLEDEEGYNNGEYSGENNGQDYELQEDDENEKYENGYEEEEDENGDNGYSMEGEGREEDNNNVALGGSPSYKMPGNNMVIIERRFRCEIPECDAAFVSEINLQRHMTTHSEIRPHKCSVCSKGFLRKEHLTKHLSSVHSGLKYRCQFCGKDISRKDHLLRHIRNCHPQEFQGMSVDMIDSEPQVAQVPTVAVNGNPNMRVAPLSCDMCSEIFNHIDELMEHQSDVHSDIRKFKCEQCPKAFKRKEHLLKHLMTHSNASPKAYGCSHCHQVFSTMEQAKVHVRNVHGQQKPQQQQQQQQLPVQQQSPSFSCNLCDNKFSTRVQLMQHMKTYHGVSNPERQLINAASFAGAPSSASPNPFSVPSRPLQRPTIKVKPNHIPRSSVGKPEQLRSLLGGRVNGDGGLGNLMGLINKGSISLSLSTMGQ